MKISSRVMFCTVIVLVLPVLAGCGGSSSSSTSAAPLAPRTASAVLPNGLTATLTEDKAAISVGGTVNYTITLTNSTTQPITYQPVNGSGPSSSIPVSLSVFTPSGQIAYPLGPSTTIIYVGPGMTLTPGQSVSETQAVSTYKDPGLTVTEGYPSAGNYTAKAVFGYVPGALPNMGQITGATVGPVGVAVQ